MNNITIELCAEDRARIDNLTTALERFHDVGAIKLTPEQTTSMASPAEQVSEPQPAAASVPTATPAPTPEPVEEPTAATEPAKEVTVEELRAKVMRLINAGKKDATRAVITSYAPNVTDVPADKRAEVLEKLNELEG